MKWIKFLFSKAFVRQLLIAVGVMALFFALLFVYLRYTTDYNETVEVPDLKGMSLSQVERVLREKELRFEVVDSIYRAGQSGIVLEQIPGSGYKVKRNRTMYLTINSFLPPMKQMDVKVGESMRVAELKLKIAGLKYETEYRSSVCNDCVLEVKYKDGILKQGDKVREGETIKLVLGQQGKRKIPAPDLKGMTMGELRANIGELSVSVGYPFYDSDIKSPKDSLLARVYDQQPKPGNYMKVGQPIDIWLTTRKLSSDSLSTKEP